MVEPTAAALNAVGLAAIAPTDPAAIATHDLPMSAFGEALAAARPRQAIKAVVRPDQP